MRITFALSILALAIEPSHAQDPEQRSKGRKQRAEIVYCEQATRDLKAVNEGKGRLDMDAKAVLEKRVKGCITILETYRDQEARRLLDMAR
jgi:hypothetical protein